LSSKVHNKPGQDKPAIGKQ